MSANMVAPDFSSLMSLFNDTAATLAFSTVVNDGAGAPVLHVDDSKSSQLVITVTNQTSGEITIEQLTGAPTSSNSNITFNLPYNQLYFYTMPTIDTTDSTPGTWTLATDSDGGWLDTIYLANTAPCTLSANGTEGDTLTLTINYGGAVPDDPKAVNVLVQVEYQNMQTAGGSSLQGTTSPQSMALMADAGRPSPLVGSFVGPATLLNNGTLQQDLTLRLVNTSEDPLQFIVPPAGDPTQSYIEVTLPVSDQVNDAVWALCGTDAWGLISPSLSGSAATGWTVTKSTTTNGVLELRPDFTTVQNIPPNGTLDLILSGVTSALEPGMVQVQVSLERFALLGTQTFGVALEKSPLIYNSGLGTGMTLAAGSLSSANALSVTGDSSSSLVSLSQSGSGASLVVSGNVGVNTSTPAVALDVQGETNITTPSGTLPLMVRSDNPGGAAAEVSIANYGGGAGTESTLSFSTYTPPAGASPSSAIVAQDDGSCSNHLYFQTKQPGSATNPLQNRMMLTSSGSLGINTTTPAQPLDVNGNANVSGALSANSATLSGDLSANNANLAGTLSAGVANISGSLSASSANISGELSAGFANLTGLTTTRWATLCPAPDYSQGTVAIGSNTFGNTMLNVANNQSTGYAVYVNAPNLSNGWWALSVTGCCINSSGSWSQFSDMALKEEVRPFGDGLTQILQMNPIKYQYKKEAGLDAQQEHVGVSAQDMETIAPYLVGKTRLNPESTDEYLCIDNGPITYMLINAIKELHAEIAALKKSNAQ